MKKIFLLLLLLLPFAMQGAEDAQAVMQKAASKIRGASTVRADFTLSAPGMDFRGSLKSKGKKFAVVSDGSCSWYDGKSLYTYSPATAETTLVNPSAADLLECNPLLYIGDAVAYKAMFSKAQPKGRYAIVLVPRAKGSGIKNIELQLDRRSLLPLRIVINSESAGSMTVALSKVVINTPISDSEFIYPKKKYPYTKIIDLR